MLLSNNYKIGLNLKNNLQNTLKTNLSNNCLAIFINSRAWVTLKSVNSEREPFKNFTMSRLICSALNFEMFISASWCKNISFNSSSFFSAFTSSRSRCTISSVCGWMCRIVLIGFSLAILELNRMVDRVTSRSSLVMRTWDTKLTRMRCLAFN